MDQDRIEKIDQVRVSGFPMTRDQKKAMYKLWDWLDWATLEMKRKPMSAPPIFRLFGLAGCGKTTCSVAIKALGLKPLYVSFTNRAVGVLASKGCTPAKTVHSILYNVVEDESTGNTEYEMQARQAYLDAVLAGVPVEERPLLPELKSNIGWAIRETEDLLLATAGHRCIVVDEASMIGSRMGEDLLKIGLPIIGIGDPGQLKPVNDTPFFNPKSPDVLLTEVLRTDGDILDAAAHVRRGGLFIDLPDGEDYSIAKKAGPEWFEVEQVLCGIHDKRRELNKHIRRLKGYAGVLPEVGEKICVVANNKQLEIFNGGLWIVTKSAKRGDYAVLDLIEYAPRKSKESLEIREGVSIHLSCFSQDIKDKNGMSIEVSYNSVYATWGYAITVHKAQGSEWNSVLLFDDGPVFKGECRNWRYTGCTRAAKKLYVVSRHHE